MITAWKTLPSAKAMLEGEWELVEEGIENLTTSLANQKQLQKLFGLQNVVRDS